MFPPPPQCSVPARYARLHYALGGGGKETKTTTNILTKVPNSFQDLTPLRPRQECAWFFPVICEAGFPRVSRAAAGAAIRRARQRRRLHDALRSVPGQ